MGQPIRLGVFAGGIGKEPELVFSINTSSEKITVREIIAKKVSEEVKNFSQKRKFSRCLEDSSANLCVKSEEEVFAAINAFKKNEFIVLVSDKEIQDLDEEINVALISRIEFYQLIPLEGG